MSGPGIAKAGTAPLIRQRKITLWESSDYRVRQMFEDADVMSEGAPKIEEGLSTYYGTTSIVLLLESCGGYIPDARHADAARLLRADPHARVRAIRIAYREAHVRAQAPLGQLHAELTVSEVATGVQIDVDVEAETLRLRVSG